jgi:DNA polymerase elongation subunit (family B)
MQRVFLDIETVPPEEHFRDNITREIVRELEIDRKNADSTEIVKATEDRFRQLALKGEHGRILTIGLLIERGSKVEENGVLGLDRLTLHFHLDEARTLRGFWKLLKDFDARFDCVIGHNIMEFDLPFIYKRSVIHQIQPSVQLSFARYRSQPIYDTMCEWDHWGRNKISLSNLAAALGLESSKQNGLDGSRVYDYYRAKRHEEIADYCKRDVQLVREIYYRMKFLGIAASTNQTIV